MGLSLGFSFEKLFNKALDPFKLCIFGCLCFPWLCSYSSQNLDPKSSSCVFLGYFLTQSAYFYFDSTLNKIFVSLHVKFAKNVFPFASPSTSTTLVLDTDFALLVASFTLGDYPAPLISLKLLQSYPSPHLTSLTSTLLLPPISLELLLSSPLPDSTSRHPTISTLPSPFQHPSLSLGLLFSTPLPPSPRPTLEPSPPLNHHPMQTRSKNAILKPNPKYDLTDSLPPLTEPGNVARAHQDPKWDLVMQEEYDAFFRNCTWSLIPPSLGKNIVGNKWVFRIKCNQNGSVAPYKARLVAKGFHQ